MNAKKLQTLVHIAIDNGALDQKLDSDIKQQWLDNLRSGAYKQGRDKLCVGDKYCCLGVLYDIVGDWWYQVDDGWACRADDNEAATSLPLEMNESCKLPLNTENFLAEINDSGATFKQIANVIEKYL